MLSTEQLLDSADVEKLIQVGSGDGAALGVARCRKSIDIPYIRVGKKRIRYRLSDVQRWLEENTVRPTLPAKPQPQAKRRTHARLKKVS
jgi:transposase InsO family protein